MNLFKRNAAGIFASENLVGHLIRGAIGGTLVVWAVQYQRVDPMIALVAGVFALIAFRGCPMCWMIGLWETVAHKIESARLRSKVDDFPKTGS